MPVIGRIQHAILIMNKHSPVNHTFPSCSCATLGSACNDAEETNAPHPYLHEPHTHSGWMNQLHAVHNLGSAPSTPQSYCSRVMQGWDSLQMNFPSLDSETSDMLPGYWNISELGNLRQYNHNLIQVFRFSWWFTEMHIHFGQWNLVVLEQSAK